MDLGPSGNTAETDVLSHHSSSDERTRSGSPLNTNNNTETASKKNEIAPSDHDNSKRSLPRDESPESEWGPNKAPRFNSPKPLDQSTTEATMRKARVSVRARSEAPMVCITNTFCECCAAPISVQSYFLYKI